MDNMTKEMNKIIKQIQEMSPEDLVIQMMSEIELLKKACKQDEESQKILDQILAKEKVELFEYAKRIKENLQANTVDPLTPCGNILSAIGWGDGTINQIPYEYTDDYLNFFSAFPLRFGLLLLNNPQALPVTLLMMNRGLYTCSLAGKWFTSGQIPQWSQAVLDKNGGYNLGATVKYNGVMYESLVNNNMATPVNGSLLDYVNWKLSPLETPVGRVFFSPNANADDGFLIANGATLSKATYWNLWQYAQHIGAIVTIDQWNAGYIGYYVDLGDDNFRIPDLRGRYLRGANSGTNNDPRRTSSEVGTYKAGNILQHNHGVDQTPHNHSDAGHGHTDAGHHHDLKVSPIAGSGGPHNSPMGNGDHQGGDMVLQSYANIQTGYASIQGNNANIGIQNTGTDQNSVNDIAYTIQIKY